MLHIFYHNQRKKNSSQGQIRADILLKSFCICNTLSGVNFLVLNEVGVLAEHMPIFAILRPFSIVKQMFNGVGVSPEDFHSLYLEGLRLV